MTEPLKIYTWADIEAQIAAVEDICPGIHDQIEAAYRRGYQHGMIDAAEYGVGDVRYLDWIADKLLYWRLGKGGAPLDKMVEPPHFPTWRQLAKSILIRDRHKCRYCGDRATVVDHIVPVSKGGGYEPDNLAAACAKCNRAKGASIWSLMGQTP